MKEFEPIATWEELLDRHAAGYRLFYQAPMDYRPVLVTVVLRKDGKLRVTAPYRDSDPFTADHAHLNRFRKETRA